MKILTDETYLQFCLDYVLNFYDRCNDSKIQEFIRRVYWLSKDRDRSWEVKLWLIDGLSCEPVQDQDLKSSDYPSIEIDLGRTFGGYQDFEPIPESEVELLYRLYQEFNFDGILAWASYKRNKNPIEKYVEDGHEFERAYSLCQMSLRTG